MMHFHQKVKMKMLFKFILIFTGFIRGLNCQTNRNINVCKYHN